MSQSRKTIPATLIRSVEDLADAKDLRAAIALALADSPINEPALRAAVWSFVGNERRADIPPAEVIARVTALIDEATIAPPEDRQRLTRQAILWCVEEYFGHLGGNPFRITPRDTPAAAQPGAPR